MARATTAPPGRGGRAQPPPTARAESGNYIVAVYQELRKVSWPTPRELLRMTQVVVATVLMFAFFIGGLDLVLSVVAKPLYSQVGTPTPTSRAPAVQRAPVTALPRGTGTARPGTTPASSSSPATSPVASPTAHP